MGIPVLVVDDDPLSGGLSKELLLDAGLDAEHMTSSLAALEALKQKRFPVVVLDILMPGMDGLTMCHKIKSDPVLRATKVIMVSGKSFAAEKKRALDYGADLFIEKPYDVATFGSQVRELAQKGLDAKAEVAGPAAMEVAVWGTRSKALAAASRYGRETPCVSVDLGGRTAVFDAGSGIKALGEELTRSGKAGEIWLFMSHFHPAHAEGLGRFAPLSNAQARVHVCAAVEPDKTLQTLVEDAILSSPVPAVPLEAQFELHELMEQTYELAPGLKLTAFYANHPGATLGFIVEARGRRLAYCPDTEIYGESARALQDFDEKLGKLVAGVDLLILDGRYSPQDYQANKNTGHSSFLAAVDCAARNEVKRLWLIHQDAKYSDAELDAMSAQAVRQAAASGMGVDLAREAARLKL